MTACYFTPAEIDDMQFGDVLELIDYWRDYPPVHEILKCVYRIEPNREQEVSQSTSDPSGIGSLIARFPDGFVDAGDGG